MLSLKLKLKLVAFATCIFIFFSLLAVLEEKVYFTRYGGVINEEDGKAGEVFKMPVAFVAVQSVVFSLVAKGTLLVQRTPEDPTSHKFHMFISMFWVSSMVTSKMALQWISYSTKLVVKSAKPIPIMILSIIFIGRSYTAQKCAVVLAIVLGVGTFSYKDSRSAESKEFSYIGNGLLFTSIMLDGLMCLAQDKMRISAKASSLHFMCYVNAWSSAFLIALMSVTGEGRDFLDFCRRHPQIIFPMLGCILAGVAGQYFISLMVINFGSLALSLITTTRKFFSVLVSALVYGNSLILRQWCASGLILTSLLLDTYFSKSKTELKNEENEEKIDEFCDFEEINLQADLENEK